MADTLACPDGCPCGPCQHGDCGACTQPDQGGPYPFNPDWTVAPAATLHELMTERHWTVARLAAHIAATTYGTGHYWPVAKAAEGIHAVLARQPMPVEFPAAMHHALGGAPAASFWDNHERLYRRDLAAGRKDTTGPTPEPRGTP